MRTPKVSVIMPCNRNGDLLKAINCFLRQDYEDKQLLIAVDHWGVGMADTDNIRFFVHKGNIGAKRNFLCDKADGEIIVHCDSDDFYHKNWISKSVEALQGLNVPCTGLRQCYYFDTVNNNGYKWSYPHGAQTYLAEATLCYYKSHWQRFKHNEVMTGECTPLYYRAKAHNYIDGFVATLHGSNTSSHNQVRTFQPIDIKVINSLYGGADFGRNNEIVI